LHPLRLHQLPQSPSRFLVVGLNEPEMVGAAPWLIDLIENAVAQSKPGVATRVVGGPNTLLSAARPFRTGAGEPKAVVIAVKPCF
jgi:hypothetical protein